MQKKQIKILGYQAENCKMKLFYETDGKNSRYIVEKNRKYIFITNEINEAKKKFTIEINKETLQLNLFETEQEKKEEPIVIHSIIEKGEKSRYFKYIEININEYNDLWKTGKYKFKGGGYYVLTDKNGKFLY